MWTATRSRSRAAGEDALRCARSSSARFGTNGSIRQRGLTVGGTISGGLLRREVDGYRVAGTDGGEQGLELGWWGRYGPGLPVALQQCGRGQPGADMPECDRPVWHRLSFVQCGLLGVPPLSAIGVSVVETDGGALWWV